MVVEFVLQRQPLLLLNIHHHIYGPMHGWACTVSHMLITFVEYIKCHFDWAQVCDCVVCMLFFSTDSSAGLDGRVCTRIQPILGHCRHAVR